MGFLGSSNPLEHVLQHPYFKVSIFGLDLTLLSNHIVMMILGGALLMLVLPRAVKQRRKGDEIAGMTPVGFGNFVEVVCAYLRKEVAIPALGPYADKFIGYIWTVFFFILGVNLLGLLPLETTSKWLTGVGIGGTATGNIWVTGTLAVLTLIMIVVNGARLHGMAYFKHFFMGPFPISILIAFLEILGLAAKTVALAIRLFANMIAGHILLAVLLTFILMAGQGLGAGKGMGIAIPLVAFSMAIYLLEIFVAFLQAFIFTFLTALFIGMAVQIHHEDHGHGEEHGHGGAHGHAEGAH